MIKTTTSCIVHKADGADLANSVRRQDLVSISSGESEFYALSSAALDSRLLKQLFEWFGFRVEWSVSTDSSAAKGMVMRQGVGKVRHMDCRALWVQQAVRKENLKIRKVDGKLNPADLGTKAQEHERLLGMVGLRDVGDDALQQPDVQVSSIIAQKTKVPNLKSALLSLCLALQAESGDGTTYEVAVRAATEVSVIEKIAENENLGLSSSSSS